MDKFIYLDNAATTKTAPEVVEAMIPYFSENFGNPSSVYEFAGISKRPSVRAEKSLQRHWEHRRTRFIFFGSGGHRGGQLGAEGDSRGI